MAYCSKCGTEMSDYAYSCPKCGQSNEARKEPSDPARLSPVEPAGSGGGSPALGGNVSVGQLLEGAIGVYRSHFVTLIKLVAIVVVPLQILSGLLAAGLFSGQRGAFDFGSQQPPQIRPSAVVAGLGAAVVLGLLGLVAQQLATGAAMRASTEAYLGETPDSGRSLQFALDRLGPLVVLAIIQAVLLILGFLACIIPGVFLAVSWSVAVPVLLMEGVMGWAALQRSMSLVQGHWWTVLATFFIGMLAASVIGFIVGALVGLLVPFGTVRNIVSGSVSSIITTPFFAALAAVTYVNLRTLKEGTPPNAFLQGPAAPPAL
ncbi:MAG TPA: zinc-ribbon domain-containing protein [Actinomycetota bacterium]|nr:zinc-ribbon domain-containing protein [Actinomycetota bacterium]